MHSYLVHRDSCLRAWEGNRRHAWLGVVKHFGRARSEYHLLSYQVSDKNQMACEIMYS